MLAAMELNGTSAIVTGGASGLGEATARVLAAAGAHVVIADLNEEAGKQVAVELGGQFAKTNVTDEEDVLAAVAAAEASGRPLRVAVNCAGIGFAARTVNRDGSPHDLASFGKVIAVNLIGTFNVMRLAASAMSKTVAGGCRRPAWRDHQHLLDRGDRGPDRPDRLLGVQGRDHRDDGARRP